MNQAPAPLTPRAVQHLRVAEVRGICSPPSLSNKKDALTGAVGIIHDNGNLDEAEMHLRKALEFLQLAKQVSKPKILKDPVETVNIGISQIQLIDILEKVNEEAVEQTSSKTEEQEKDPISSESEEEQEVTVEDDEGLVDVHERKPHSRISKIWDLIIRDSIKTEYSRKEKRYKVLACKCALCGIELTGGSMYYHMRHHHHVKQSFYKQ